MASLKQRTASSLLWGLIGNGSQQMLNLVIGIFLANILMPSDYGLVGMLSVFALIASALQESGFISALNRKREALQEDYDAVFYFNILMAAALYALLFCCAPLLAAFFDEPLLTPLGRLVFLSFLFSAFGTAPRAWLFRNLRVRQTTLIQFAALLLSGLIGIALALHGFAYWGIALQQLIYCLATTLGCWMAADWRPRRRICFKPLREMWAYSWCLLATTIATHLNANFFSLVFGKLYGATAVGHFNQANKWTWMGGQVLVGMVGSVAQPVMARLQDDAPERKRRILRKMLRFTAFLSMPALLGLALVAPELIPLAIGDKWLPAAGIMRWLCIGTACTPICTLFSNFLMAEGRSRTYMLLTLALLLCQMLLMVILHPYGMTAMVQGYTALSALWVIVWYVPVRRLCALTAGHLLHDIAPYLLLALAAMVAAHFCADFAASHLPATATCTHERLLRLFVKIPVAAVLYVLALALLRVDILREAWAYLRRRPIDD